MPDEGPATEAVERDLGDRDPVVETPGEVVWDREEYGHSTLPVRLYEEPRWRDTGDSRRIEFYRPDKGSWVSVKAHWAPVLEGLVDGESIPMCEVRLRDARPDMNAATRKAVVRKVVGNLERLGMAEIVTPDPPEVFEGRYEVLEQLGRGGMGVVWLCRDRDREGARVAVKHAWNWRMPFEGAESSLVEEAERLRAFDHPAIVDLVDTFEVEGRFHMVREFLDGRSLASWCGDPDLGEPARVRLLGEIGELLAYFRDEGWLYLDPSPGNFYVDEVLEGLTLTDLGLCKRAPGGEVTASRRKGTLRYAAPEMMDGGAATQRSLIYSLGRVLWKMVTGRIPVARTSLEKVHRQDRAILELLRDSRASRREVDFFDHATRTDPEDRPETIEEALAILEA